MTEFELIAKLTRGLPTNSSVVAGAGDDCAILNLCAPDTEVLFKTDAVVEGFHFTKETEPQRVGRKALGRCLSDIAAMGGKPVAAVITIGLPPKFEAAKVEAIYEGINALAKKYEVAIVGGETTTNPERIWISVALLGTVPRGKAVRRTGAQVGDAIFVSGQLGGSLNGRHLDFDPRIREAQWLTENFQVHAMLDLSDGLAGDLGHILRASKVGAELLSPAIPISREAKLAARAESSAKPPLLAALTDGEDFELLFTVGTKDAVPVLDGWKKQFPKVPLSCIGKITKGEGIMLRDKQGVRALSAHGYVHFK